MDKFATIEKPWLKHDYGNRELLDVKNIEMSVNRFLWTHSGYNPDLTALNWFDHEISFEELKDNIDQTAHALLNYGVKENDVVTICSICTPEVVYLFYALDLIGAMANMVDPRTSTSGLHHYIEEVNSKLVVTLDIAYPKIQEAVEETLCKTVLVISPADSLIGIKKAAYILKNKSKYQYSSRDVMWKDFFGSGFGDTEELSDDNYDPERGLLIVHTGGTTGAPKGVMLSSLAINAVSYQCDVRCEGIGGKWLNVMPPFIAYGFCVGIHTPLSHGVQSILIPQIDPEKLGSLFLKYKPNYMAGVPTHYETLIHDPKIKNKDLSFMKGPYCGGDAMSSGSEEEINEVFHKHGIAGVINGYGMTEVSALCCVAAPGRTKVGSVGYPMGLTTIACFNPETGEEVPLGTEGEVCITGPNMMIGYYDNPVETANIIRKHDDGRLWIHSGDIGVMDEDGYLTIRSRIKRIIIRHDGFKIFSKVIEDAISMDSDIEEVSAVGVKDVNNIQGKVPVAYFTLKKGCKKQEEVIIREVKKICEREIPEYCLPKYYSILTDMPYTPIGKIDYRSLEKKAIADFL